MYLELLDDACGMLSVASGFAAAWLWYRASAAPIPPPAHGTPVTMLDIETEFVAITRIAKLNRSAAVATGMTTLSTALSALIGHWR